MYAREVDLATGFFLSDREMLGGKGTREGKRQRLVRDLLVFYQQCGIHKAFERCTGESGGLRQNRMWKISREAESQKIFLLAAIRSRCVFAERLPPRMHGTFPAGARLWRLPNARPRSAGVRGRTALMCETAARVRFGSRCPALAAQLCPLYLPLPEAQQKLSPCICR